MKITSTALLRRDWGEGQERRRADRLGGSGWMLGAWTCAVVVQLMRSTYNLKANKIGSLDSFDMGYESRFFD